MMGYKAIGIHLDTSNGIKFSRNENVTLAKNDHLSFSKRLSPTKVGALAEKPHEKEKERNIVFSKSRLRP